MGLLSNIMQGIGAGATASAPFIKNMQEEDIQKLRDERLAEIAKGAADYSANLARGNIDYGIKAKNEDADKGRKRVAGLLSSVSSTRDDATPEGVVVQTKLSDQELGRAKIAALEQAGEFGPEHERLSKSVDRIEDNTRLDKAQVSADQKWHTQFAELTRHNKAIEGKAADELNLKTEDRKALSEGMKRYMSLISFRAALDKNTPEQDVAKVDADINGLAASMAQYGIKLPGTERKGDPLSSIVAGARLITDLNSSATESQKGEAIDTVSAALKTYGAKAGLAPAPKYPPGQILEKKDGTRWQVDANGVPQPMKK